jgi:hypothetical protein
MEPVDLLALEARLEAEVGVGERLHGREAGGTHRGHESPIVAQADLGTEQGPSGRAFRFYVSPTL